MTGNKQLLHECFQTLPSLLPGKEGLYHVTCFPTLSPECVMWALVLQNQEERGEKEKGCVATAG